MTYLAQSLVALHHSGQSEQAHAVAARLFALTEPEGYLRVYLDEGEPMRQALLRCSPRTPGSRSWLPHRCLYFKAPGRLRVREARRESIRCDGNHSRARAFFCAAGTGCLIRAGCLPHPARAGSLAPARRRGLESGYRSNTGDFPGHREKTRQQSARQVRSLQSHASDYPGTCPLPAITKFLPTPGLSARKPTLFLHF